MAETPDARAVGKGTLEEALALYMEEQRKLEEFQQRLDETTTMVESPNKVVSATFDGRGELVQLSFNNTKYRTMPPSELGALVTETISRGRQQAFATMDQLSGHQVMPGVGLGDLAQGKVDVTQVVNSMFAASFENLIPLLGGTADKTERPDAPRSRPGGTPPGTE
ncbi:YbaB/EbfC family nucleoid-associated protein [Catenuloplanes atrovinosus]|uniref:DNA-binding protein YbaB n=1 Tax=Catenuloplanes atrovinosus TaxID=137266 RepID=A0AAE3YRG0_9ACTN|nr:YbaB/EbfC family nucleoid-associated protein [Catenuloplanes atrovinosus]MDR7277291.1 DNA-binding protein YbaB [Catenuloplanes atrovinosus]